MSKEIPHAPRRKPYVLPGGQDPSNDTFNISEEDMPDDYKKAISDAYAYKVQLEKKMVGFAEDTVFTDSEYTSDESTGKHKREEFYEGEKRPKARPPPRPRRGKASVALSGPARSLLKWRKRKREEFYEGEKRPKARPPPKPRRGKASVALSDIRRNIEQKKALKEKKRREKLGIIRKGYCSRKLFVDETDLEDLSFFDAENIEKGEIRSKRFPKDYALDRLMDISPAYTGMCRDCWKRADYIVVFCATGDDLYADELKVGFLSTLVKIGFDLEIERGVMPEHNNLLFCKIHATDPLLADYKDHFEISKYFQDNHVHMIGKKGMKPYWTDYFRPVHEREWVKMMRRRYIKPLRLSNRDRSYITYMIVCHQPFGIRDKYYGMYRLLKKKILIDGFALHDGPYFITADQLACNANGRQILFHNWAGFSNMFMSQPLSVINEYYGPKLACFFAFYQFFLWMMLLMIPISIFVLLPAWRFLKNLFVGEGSNMYCEAAKLAVRHLCPTCMDFNACPLRNLSDYCEVHKFVRLTQRIMILSPIFTTWCVFFFFCWKRKQNYWRWLWEIRPKPRHPIVRVEYELKYQTAKRSRLTGIWTFRSTYKRILERIAAPFIVTLAIAIPFLGTITIYYYNVRILRNTSFLMKGIIKNNTKMLKYRDYIALGIALPVFFVGSVIFELIFARLSELMTKWENHRFVKNYERSLTYRYFAVSLIYTFPCMIFVSWIKGRFFAHPLEHWRTVVNITTSFFHINKSMPFLGHFLYFHCNKTINCIDEMVFTFFLFIIFMTTTLAFKHFFRLFPRILKWAVTDFNLSREKEYNAPEWEREYKLKPLHDNTVLQWTNQVVIQLAFFVWFGNIAPYLSIIVFFANLAFVRVLGKQLVRYYRRPTLHNCRGLGTYNKVINFVLLASPLAHAFNNSRMDIFWKNTFLTKNFSLINESRNAYINMPWQYKMNVCLYPTKFRHYYPLAELTLPWPYHWLNISNNVTQLVASHNRYIVEMNKAADIIKYTHSFLLFIVMLFMYFPSKNKFVQERSMKEDEIKRYAIHEEFIFNDDEHGDIIQ